MKRVISVLLVLAVCLCLCACGAEKPAQKNNPESTETVEVENIGSGTSLKELETVINEKIASKPVHFSSENTANGDKFTTELTGQNGYKIAICGTTDTEGIIQKIEFSGYDTDMEVGWTEDGKLDWSNVTYTPKDISEFYNAITYDKLQSDLKNSSNLTGYQLNFDTFWLSYSYVMCCLGQKSSTFKEFKDYYGVAEIIKAKTEPQQWEGWEYRTSLSEDNTTILFVAEYISKTA